MAKEKVKYICQSCNYISPKWLGRCPECNEWNTFAEEVEVKEVNQKAISHQNSNVPLTYKTINQKKIDRIDTYNAEFNRVLGGGIVPGTLILVGGEPGIGKTTLLTKTVGAIAENDQSSCLYISGEESYEQIASRGKRLGIQSDYLFYLHENSLQKIKGHILKMKPKVVIIDSIQTTISEEIANTPGTVTQIREVTYEIMNLAKSVNTSIIIVGHITKEGNIAGPKILEHMVDVVVYFEGDQYGQYRLLRAMKNRFGNTNEVGLFEMTSTGLLCVKNPSKYFLDDPLDGAYGRSISSILEGSRTLFLEIQALVVENKYGNGRRTTQGIDSNRLSMIVAVIEKYFDLPFGFNDIYINIVGGLKVTTREIDLSVLVSILSSFKRVPVPDDSIFLGEIGLTGEVRSIPMLEQRLKEIALMNYKNVYLSYKQAAEFKKYKSLKLVGLKKVTEIESYL